MDKSLRDQLTRIREDISDLEALYRRIFSTPDGQLVLLDLEDRFFYNAPVDTPIEEGMRRAVLHIHTMLTPTDTVNRKALKNET